MSRRVAAASAWNTRSVSSSVSSIRTTIWLYVTPAFGIRQQFSRDEGRLTSAFPIAATRATAASASSRWRLLLGVFGSALFGRRVFVDGQGVPGLEGQSRC